MNKYIGLICITTLFFSACSLQNPIPQPQLESTGTGNNSDGSKLPQLPANDQQILDSGQKIVVIVAVNLDGDAKNYFDMVAKNPDEVARQRAVDPQLYKDMEAAADKSMKLVKSQVLSKLLQSDYSDYVDYASIPSFAISVNKEGLQELASDPLVKSISENKSSVAF